jgi:hypothetical protein
MKILVKLLLCLAPAWIIVSCNKEEIKYDFITFEEIELGAEGYWNGSDNSGGFTSGNGFFPNTFTDWGEGMTSWTGFACSSQKDRFTPGYENQYSSYAGAGANNSEKFGLVYLGDTLVFTISEKIESIQVTNTTYAALSMAEGDAVARKFQQGDYFHLIIKGIDENDNITGIATIALADFTDENENNHYITNHWTLIDLDFMGVVKKLVFSFESSDTSEWGINTPTYACIDNIRGIIED